MANYNSSHDSSPLAASAFEYRYRAWILITLYLVALACFRFDRRDIAYTVARWFAGMSTPPLPEATTARLVYLFGALLIAIAALFVLESEHLQPPLTSIILFIWTRCCCFSALGSC